MAEHGGRPAARDPDVFAALADPTRRLLLDRLAAGECTVTELTEGLTMSQAAISQHLRLLRQTGLVEVRQEGRYRRYCLRPDGFASLRDWLAALDEFWQRRAAALDTFLAGQ